MVIRFTIPGEPKGKGRPRLGRSGHAYTPHDTAVYENLVKVCFKGEYPEFPPIGPDTGITVRITAYYGIPKSTSKKKRLAMLLEHLRPLKKPDCDNIVKIVCDALNGIAYHDDAQIYELYFIKKYSDTPRVEMSIGWETYDEQYGSE